jgi:hypothetical protein
MLFVPMLVPTTIVISIHKLNNIKHHKYDGSHSNPKLYLLAQKHTTQHNCRNLSTIHLAKQKQNQNINFLANQIQHTIEKDPKLDFDHPNPNLSQPKHEKFKTSFTLE